MKSWQSLTVLKEQKTLRNEKYLSTINQFLPLGSVVDALHGVDEALVLLVVGVHLPLLGLEGQPPHGLRVHHAEVVEHEEGLR